VLRRDLLALYGSAFQEGATTLVILALSHWVNVSFGMSGWIMLGGGRSRLLLRNNVIVAVVNIVLGVTLIPRLGLLGAAFAALGSVVLLQMMLLLEVRLAFGIYPFDSTVLKPLAAAAATVGVELALNAHVAPSGVRIPLVIVSGLVCYVTALGLLGLAPEEQQLVTGARARLRSRKTKRSA
jgi:O-antigen/teichoic acid export membrane protein